MKHNFVKKYKAWFQSKLQLDEIGNILIKLGLIESYEYDYENVYEWLEAPTSNEDIELNISRKHRDGEGHEMEPIHIMAMYSKQQPSDEHVENIARMISKEFLCNVSLGYIEYISGNDYKYIENKQIISYRDRNGHH